MRTSKYGRLAGLLAAVLLLSGCGAIRRPGGGGPAPVPVELPGGTTAAESECPPTSPGSVNAPIEAPTPEITVPSETAAAVLPPARTFTDEDFHFYDGNTGSRVEGKINVAFWPDQRGPDGKPDPDIRVWDSCEITHPEEMRAICQRILDAPLYDPAVYGRSLESMVTEWRAHNDVHAVYPNERTRHVDFNRADEGLSYTDFWKRAVRDYLDSRKP